MTRRDFVPVQPPDAVHHLTNAGMSTTGQDNQASLRANGQGLLLDPPAKKPRSVHVLTNPLRPADLDNRRAVPCARRP